MYRLIVLFICGLFFKINCSQPELKFIHYKQSDGLVYNDVLSICQDSLGFMWFGTKQGISRFDGMEFVNFKEERDNLGTIKKGWVKQIVTDMKGQLWFIIPGKHNSLFTYNYDAEIFKEYSSFIATQLNIENQSYNSVFCDSFGKLWLGTESGPIVFDPVRLEVHNLRKKWNEYPHMNSNGAITIHKFYEDGLSNIWIATNSGIFIYDRGTDSFMHITHKKGKHNGLSADICTSIYSEDAHTFWVGTYNGLNKIEIHDNKYAHITIEQYFYDPADENSLSDNLIYDIGTDNNGNLLIATVHGLCMMERESGRINRYFHDELNPASISSNIVRTFYRDRNKNIWIGTSHGICKLKSSSFIKTFTFSSYRNSLSHNKVKNFCEISPKEFWIATPKGIDSYNRETNAFDLIIKVNPQKGGLSGPPILLSTDDNIVWIGTYQGRLSAYNRQSKTISEFKIPNATNTLKTVPAILKDKKGNLWINGHGQNLYIYNPEKGELFDFPQSGEDKNTLSSYLVSSMLEDTDSTIWITTNNGLNKIIDAEKGICKRYLQGTKTNHVIEGKNKMIWIASENGLFQLNKKTDKLSAFNEQIGLEGEVFSIIEDSSANLWLSTDIGISRFNFSKDSLRPITTFRKEDGLPSVGFLSNSCQELSDGTILFGSTEGFCMFHPSQMAYDTIAPEVVFTNFKVGQKQILPGQQINGQTILKKSISKTQKIDLNHKNNDFTIVFSSLYSNIPFNNQYYYTLEKAHSNTQEWTHVTAQKREAKFMNLSSGDYIFRVKCANGYGLWNKKEAVMHISILAPWWETIWFISICIVLLFVLFYLILKQRTIHLQKQKQKLEQIVNKRTQELQEVNTVLEEQKQETEQMAMKLHEADQDQLRFFTNISHEFRTPLTLILGPMQRILNIGGKAADSIAQEEIAPETLHNYHKIIFKNATRLLKLINQILDIRKYSQVSEKVKRTNNNISGFINEIIDAFKILANQKNIQITFQIQYPTLGNDQRRMFNDFWFNPDVMEKIFYNLISNAIKYTSEGGNISIAIGVVEVETHGHASQQGPASLPNTLLEIKISDTGIGIKPENIEKIFNRFYRGNNNSGEGKTGTGIGLAFTKELVGTHGGHISVESLYGKGTAFTLYFPFKKNDIEHESEKDPSINLHYTKTLINETKLLSEVKKFTAIEKAYRAEYQKHTDKKTFTVLVVEDNSDMQNFIKNELHVDYNIILAGNGKEGLDKAKNIKPDIIISDIMMPEMDGAEMCEKLKDDYQTSHIPVVFLTAKAGEENIIEGLKTGGDDYINKPFHIDILKLKIKNLLKSREILKEKFSSSIIIKPEELTASSNDELFLKKAFEIVESNLSRADFSNDEFISLIGHSRTVVYEKIKALTNQSIGEFIRTIRLKKAAIMLLQGNKTVSEVADSTGFKYRESFYKSFTTMFKKSPKQFIKEHMNK